MSRGRKYSDSEIIQSLDEAEDLTLYADEDFDTNDVDLFEYTGEDDSPLTNLKSIILSLDWEITAEILDEMLEEIRSLQQLWRGDKVLNIYLQGLSKIGIYIKNELANAHPNSVKMLSIFFANLEKLVSSDKMSEAEIKKMVGDDIRKFRIMRYQISRRRISSLTMDTQDDGGADSEQMEKRKELRRLQAIILGIDWEISDKTLQSLTREIDTLSYRYKNDSYISTLLQGLRSLGRYIALEKSQTHPDAFPLLHSFYEGIEKTVLDEKMAEEEKKLLLTEKIDKLNALRATVAEEKAVTDGESVQDARDTELFTDMEIETVADNQVVQPVDKEEEMDGEDIAFLSDEAAQEVAQEEPAGMDAVAPAAALSGFTEDLAEDEEAADLAVDLSDEIDSHVSEFFAEDSEPEDAGIAAESELADTEEVSTLKDVLFADEELDEAEAETEEPEPDVIASLSDETIDDVEDAELLKQDDGPLREQLDRFFSDEDEPQMAEGSEGDGEVVGEEEQPRESLADESGDITDLSGEEITDDDVITGIDEFFGPREDGAEDETVIAAEAEEDVVAGDLFADEPAADAVDVEAAAREEPEMELPELDAALADFEHDGRADISMEDLVDEDLDSRLDSFFREDDETGEPDAAGEISEIPDIAADSLAAADQVEPQKSGEFAGLEEEVEQLPDLFEDDAADMDLAQPRESDDLPAAAAVAAGVAAVATAAAAGDQAMAEDQPEPEEADEEFVQDIDPQYITMLDDDEEEDDDFFAADVDESAPLFTDGGDEETAAADEETLPVTEEVTAAEAVAGEKATGAEESEPGETDESVAVDFEEDSESRQQAEAEEQIAEAVDAEKSAAAEEEQEEEAGPEESGWALEQSALDLGVMLEGLAEEKSDRIVVQCRELVDKMQQSPHIDQEQGVALKLLHSSLEAMQESIGEPEQTAQLARNLGDILTSSLSSDGDAAGNRQGMLIAAMGEYIHWQQGLIKEVLRR